MNKIDRKRLLRLMELIDTVPFANIGSGGATASGLGLMGFDQDMRAIRPYLRKVLEGMLLEGIGDMEEGWDYDSPDKLLDVLEEWVRQRTAERWQGANSYSLTVLWKEWQGEEG